MEEQIAAMFRAQELQRRQVRRDVLLAQAELDSKESLTPKELADHEHAMKVLRMSQRSYAEHMLGLAEKSRLQKVWMVLTGKL